MTGITHQDTTDIIHWYLDGTDEQVDNSQGSYCQYQHQYPNNFFHQ
jgi:hypothetical protein